MKRILFVFSAAALLSACTAPQQPAGADSAALKARVQQFYDEVINGHNLAAIDSFITPDFVDHNPDPGYSGNGIADVKAMFSGMLTSFPDLRATTHFMIASGDTVMTYVTMTGTQTGPMGDMPASNKPIHVDGIDIIVVKDGKATERWGVFDNMAMMQQMGMIPAAGAPADSSMKQPM
jgi:steroid delta-isomerase-like uncharacterized protein